MDGLELSPTAEGTPQGGVISPLLANVALHGLEEAVRAPYPQQLKGHQTWKPMLIRYADDFVVLHENLAVIEEVKQLVSDWMAGMGLELKPSKTRITHTFHSHDDSRGFDFLGWHVRQFPVGKTHSARRGNGRYATVRLGFKTLIRPSEDAQRRHYERICEIVDRHTAAPQAALIDHLNPVVRGWARYHSAVSSGRVFNKMRHRTYVKLQRWARRRHPKKSGSWVSAKYWRLESGRWDFATKEGHRLYCHSRTAIQRHVKVRGEKSPYDGDWVYWASRLGRHPELPRRVAKLLHWQKGRCAICGLYFGPDDLPEVDHTTPLVMGGKDGYTNWQLVHAHCHDDKTARDGSLAVG